LPVIYFIIKSIDNSDFWLGSMWI